MISFFQIRTWQKAHMSVSLKGGRLLQHGNLPAENFVPVIAFKLDSFPQQLFLTTDHPDKPIIHIDHYRSPRGSIIPVTMKSCNDNNTLFSFEDPQNPGKYFTTHPFNGDNQTSAILGDCHHVMAWEEFTLVPVSVSSTLEKEANQVAALFDYNLTAEKVFSFIKGYMGPDIRPLLDAILPFFHWDELNQFAVTIFKNRALFGLLQKKCLPTLWTDKIIPDLFEWQTKRSSYAENLLLPAQKITSPIEECFLDGIGEEGTFSGFLHALTHIMRRSIKPARGTCIVSTQRNEGLYLLEWIAYHQMLGIEHFFIYSNDNDDHSELLLEILSEKGIITWIRNDVDSYTSPQFKAYGHAFNVLPDILDFKWCFVIDGDEFITLNPEPFPRITDYLSKVERKETDALAVNWRFIGSALNTHGLADLALPLTERNTNIVGSGAIGEGWRLVKSACRPQKTLHSRAHHPQWYNAASYNFRLTNGTTHEFINPPPGFSRDPAFADIGWFGEIYISHFYFKSMVEWTWKHARNSGADSTKKMDTSRYNQQWANAFGLQIRDPQTDKNEWVLQRAKATRTALAKLREIPSITNVEAKIRKTVETYLLNLNSTLDRDDLKQKIKPEWHFILNDLELELSGHITGNT